jgi:prepilin-type processing-associated H-X9-DG protein
MPPDINGQFTSYDDEFHNFAIARHGKGINVVYFDGSVRYTRARDLWGLKWSKGYDPSAANNITFPAWMN